MWDYLEPVARMLEPLTVVHRFDQRGCGGSDGSSQHSVARYVADIEALHLHWRHDAWIAQQRGRATHAAGTPDLKATVIDEHRDGLVRSSVSHGDADHDAVRAGQQRRMAQTFPQLTVVQATRPHLAGKQPAQTVPTRQRGRAR